MFIYTLVCHSMCPKTLPRKLEIEGESASHPSVDIGVAHLRCGLVFRHASRMSPHVPQPSGLSAKHKVSSFAWGGLLSLLGGRLCISGCPLLSDVCAVSEGCQTQGLMATLRSTSLCTWHRFAMWIACGVLWCVEISAGESASLPSVDIGVATFAMWAGVPPCVEDVSARASALRAVGQAQS